jgi:hypothetical protein
MTRLERQLEASKGDEMPTAEEIEAAVAALPLLVGADGVMVPFRPDGGWIQLSPLSLEIELAR